MQSHHQSLQSQAFLLAEWGRGIMVHHQLHSLSVPALLSMLSCEIRPLLHLAFTSTWWSSNNFTISECPTSAAAVCSVQSSQSLFAFTSAWLCTILVRPFSAARYRAVRQSCVHLADTSAWLSNKVSASIWEMMSVPGEGRGMVCPRALS